MAWDTPAGGDLDRSSAMKSGQFACFLGAANQGSPAPTAFDMIRGFKSRRFRDAVGVPRREIESSDAEWPKPTGTYLDGNRG